MSGGLGNGRGSGGESTDSGVWQIDKVSLDESECDGNGESGDNDTDEGNISSFPEGCCCVVPRGRTLSVNVLRLTQTCECCVAHVAFPL